MKACLGLRGRLWAVGSLVCDWPKPISYLDPRRGQGQGRKDPSQPSPIFRGLAPPLPNSAPCSSSSFYSLFSEVGKHPYIATCMHSLLLHGNIFFYGYTLKFPRLQALSNQTKFSCSTKPALAMKAWLLRHSALQFPFLFWTLSMLPWRQYKSLFAPGSTNQPRSEGGQKKLAHSFPFPTAFLLGE